MNPNRRKKLFYFKKIPKRIVFWAIKDAVYLNILAILPESMILF